MISGVILSALLAGWFVPYANADLTVAVPPIGIAPGQANVPLDVVLTPSAPETLSGFTIVLRIVPTEGSTGSLEFASPPTQATADYVFAGNSRGFHGVLQAPTLAYAFDVTLSAPVPVVATVGLATFTLNASADFGGAWRLQIDAGALALDGGSAGGKQTIDVGVAIDPPRLDVDGNGVTDTQDYDELAGCFTGPGEVRMPWCPTSDLDGDFDVDCVDVSILRSFVDIGDCAFGDFDCDRDVDRSDHAVFVAAMRGPGVSSPCQTFDQDGNGALDLKDFAAFQLAFTPFPPPNKFWIVDAGGFWHDPANWSDNEIPGPDDVVVIDRPAGEYTITVSEGEQSCAAMTSEERIAVTGGTIAFGGPVQVNNEFKLGAGTIAGGTIMPGSGGQGLTPPTTRERGTLRGVTLQADMTLVRDDYLNIDGGMTLNGAITMAASVGSAELHFVGAGALLGTGAVYFDPNQNGSFSLGSEDEPWIIGPDVTIHGGAGRVGGRKGFLNQGTIRAEAAGKVIRVSEGSNEGTLEVVAGAEMRIKGNSFTGGPTYVSTGEIHASGGSTLTFEINWQNAGLMTATDSTVNFGGTSIRGAIGLFVRSGGVVNITGTLDNTGNTLLLDETTGSWTLKGGTILGGRVIGGGGATLIAGTTQGSAPGKLDGVIVDADLLVLDTTINFLNNVAFNGTATLNNGTIEFPYQIVMPDQVLQGRGEIVFDDEGTLRPRVSRFIIGPGMTVRSGTGGGYVGTTYYTGTLINQGSIISDTPGETINVNGGYVTNEGSMRAVNGGRIYANADTGIAALGVWTNAGSIYVGKSSSFVVYNVSDGFTQTAEGSISVELGGTLTADRGIVHLGNPSTGSSTVFVTLDGTLNVVLVDGYVPPVGTTIDIVSYSPGLLTGQFALINGLDIGNGTVFQPTYTNSALVLEVVAP